jgi:hypothetical protein
MNSYNWTLEEVRSKIRGSHLKKGRLDDGDIDKEINEFKEFLLLVTSGPDILKQHVFNGFEYSDLSESEWDDLGRELKSDFNVSWDEGYISQGEEQQNRDTTWWTDRVKHQGENYYWDRYRKYTLKGLNKSIVDVINLDTDTIVNNIGDPEDNKFDRYGMVVGHVQSGKTGNYSALVCKAADAGYRFFVIIAGDKNNLRNQTQDRINETFIGECDGNKQCGVGIGDSNKKKKPVSLTLETGDFDAKTAERLAPLNLDNLSAPIVLVIKKNASILSNLTEWLERNYKNVISEHAMLVIDDESDYASVNTKKASDPTSINSKIRTLLSLFHKRAYVAYTATPYANIFIDYKAENSQYGKDLFPKDFLYTLDAPTNYFGGKEVFIKNPDRYLVKIDDHQDILPVKHKIDDHLESLPLSLYDAIRVFLINVSIRNLRGHNNKHNSMLIHVSRFTIMHITVASEVEEYISSIKKAVVSFARLPSYRQESEHFKDLETTFNKQYVNKDIELEYDWSEVLDSLHQCIETIIIRQVHAKKTIPLEYNDLQPVNVIVVGGTSLSRGYTLEGLSVSYFLRGTMFYDTLMQMARWFGYRSGYQDLCRIYMTLDMMDNFTHIYEATKELFDSFIEMADQKKTPYDFGLAVVEHPSSALQVTARNKMNNTSQKDVAMRLEGLLKETAWIGKEQKDIDSNLKTVSDFVLDLNKKSNPETLGRSYLWRDVNWNDVDFFLQNFIVFTSDPFGVNSKMPIEFVKGFVLDNKGEWDISLHGGIGKKYKVGDLEIATEERKFKDKGGYFEVANRQISSGNSEAISIPDRKSIGSDRRKARCFPGRNNLLMLHILELEGDNGFVAAFGVSFSGDGSSGDKTIRLRMNKVMSDEISDFYYEEKKEEEYDD